MARDASGGEEIHPLPMPLAELPLVKEVKGTTIVSSLRGLRDGGHFEAYLANLAPEHRDAIPMIVAGEWVSIKVALVHYRACEALGLHANEVVRLGAGTAQRISSNFFATLAKIAKTSGATPWTALGQMQRVFEASFRGGGGTRVVKLGPKEARAELVAFPLVGIPWCRHGWRGVMLQCAELFCERCYAHEIDASATSVAYRLSWV